MKKIFITILFAYCTSILSQTTTHNISDIYGGEKEGVKIYIEKLVGELKDTMVMCGAFNLAEITKDMVRL